jgi:SAM-dependent methyltransferase
MFERGACPPSRGLVQKWESFTMVTPHSVQAGFRELEQSRWQNIVSEYEHAFRDLNQQAIEPLLDAVGAGPEMRLLDVATGPGYVAAAAWKRGASVTAIDFSPPMLAVAHQRNPAIEFVEGDAEALPFDNGSFDALVMNFGMLHLERPDQALEEGYRVLRPRGRIGFTVYAPPEESMGLWITLGAVRVHGTMDVPVPEGPPFFRFSDPEECQRTLQKMGFVNPSVVRVPQVWRLPSPDALFDVMLLSTVRVAALLRAQTLDALRAIRKAMSDAATAYLTKEGGVELPMPAMLTSATKPADDEKKP